MRLAHASEWIQDKASWFMSVVPRKKRLGRRKTFRVKTMRLRQASDRLERTGRLATPRVFIGVAPQNEGNLASYKGGLVGHIVLWGNTNILEGVTVLPEYAWLRGSPAYVCA